MRDLLLLQRVRLVPIRAMHNPSSGGIGWALGANYVALQEQDLSLHGFCRAISRHLKLINTLDIVLTYYHKVV